MRANDVIIIKVIYDILCQYEKRNILLLFLRAAARIRLTVFTTDASACVVFLCEIFVMSAVNA